MPWKTWAGMSFMPSIWAFRRRRQFAWRRPVFVWLTQALTLPEREGASRFSTPR